jgi:RND family efflux transporter MFP subunit
MRIFPVCVLGLCVQVVIAQDVIRVTVAHPLSRDTAHYDFTGTIEPAQSVDIRAGVNSKVVKMHVKMGDKVSRGDPILDLDRSQPEARLKQLEQTVQQAEAEVKRVKALLPKAEQLAKMDAKALANLREEEVSKFQAAGEKARLACQELTLKNSYWKSHEEFRRVREALNSTLAQFKARKPGQDLFIAAQQMRQALNRMQPGKVPLEKSCADALTELKDILADLLVLCRAVTPQGVEAMKAESALAETVLKTNQQSRDLARSELEQTKVVAPITGTILRLPVKVGDTVEASTRSATLLATLAQTDVVGVVFDVDAGAYRDYQERLRTGEGKAATGIAIGLTGKTDKGFPFSGKVDFVDNRIDPKKNVVQVHALFDDAKGQLTALLQTTDKKQKTVRVRLTLGESQKVLLVPPQVILEEGGTKRVLVVNAKNMVEERTVKLGGETAGMQVIESGLAPTDWVILGSERVKREPQQKELSPADVVPDVRLLRVRAGMTVQPVRVVLPKLTK